MKTYKIEHSGNCVYAVITSRGPAVYPTLQDAKEAIDAGSVEIHDGDSDYYARRDWLPLDEFDRIIADQRLYDSTTGKLLIDSSGRPDLLDIDYSVIRSVESGGYTFAAIQGPSGDIDVLGPYPGHIHRGVLTESADLENWIETNYPSGVSDSE